MLDRWELALLRWRNDAPYRAHCWRRGSFVRAEITFSGSASPAARYVGWAPVAAQIRLADTTGATEPVTVRLRNQNTSQGGQVEFFASVTSTGQAEIELLLPVTGEPADIRIAGHFQRPSSA